MIFSFKIKNTAFGKSDIYTLLDSNQDCLKIMIMNSNEQGTWQQIVLMDKNEENDDNFNIVLNNDEIIISCDFNTAIFEEQDFKKYPLYATYTIVYSNENLPIEPTPHNYILENQTFRIIEPKDLNDENIQKADAILNKWINQDSVKIVNLLVDEHKHFYIGKNRKIVSENSDKFDNVILTKDNESEEVTWRLPRYYDGIDLTTKNISIYYIRPIEKDNTSGGESEPQCLTETLTVEEWDDEYIWATWVVTDLVTNVAGTLTYSIIAEGDGLKDEYFWQSYPSTFLIEGGIYGNLQTGEQDFSFIDKKSFRTDVYQTIEELKAIHEAGEIKWQSLADLL